MSQSTQTKKAFFFSCGIHFLILLLLIASYEFSSPPPVEEETSDKMINAVALTQPSTTIKPLLQTNKKAPTPPSEPQPDPKVAENTPAPTPKMAIPDPSKKHDLKKELLADLEDQMAQKKKAHKALVKSFDKTLKQQAAKDLQQSLKDKKEKLAQARAQQRQGIVDKYKAQILETIGQNWIVPGGVDKNLSCQLLIHLAPGGIVLDVQITKSSGDEILDRSARAAVFKASPLPVPIDIYSFEPFRSFVLKVKPENVVEVNGDKGFWLG